MKKGYVLVEQEWVPIDDTIFGGISEDLFGQDVYEFKYKGKVRTSHVVLRDDGSDTDEQTNAINSNYYGT